MSELHFGMLQENIRRLLKKHDLTQSELASIAGMSQGNFSKALNPEEKKQFTLEQLYRIAQHFGVSIDELVGNKAAKEASTSPRAILAFITQLLCDVKIRATTVTVEEWVYEPMYNEHGYPDCRPEKRNIEYTAFYFPDYHQVDDFAFEEHEQEELHYEYLSGGNDTKLQALNDVLKKLIPLIKLYRETEIPDEAFQMILNGYLEQLSDK